MKTVTLELAQQELPALLRNLTTGEDLLIIDGAEPLAKVSRTEAACGRPAVFGCCKGMFHYRDGWDGAEEDFKPYSE